MKSKVGLPTLDRLSEHDRIASIPGFATDPIDAKHSLEPFANHPFRLPCRIAPRSFLKLLRLLLKNFRLFLLPGILLHLDKM